jgi:two-component system NtrC family sensor kinase
MEEYAGRIVHYLYGEFTKSGTRQCALVRFFKTHPFGDLQKEQRTFARRMLGNVGPTQSLVCLTLLATAGDESDWNSRHTSRGHMAIPLVSEGMVANAPMISQLITQFGIDVGRVVRPQRHTILDQEQTLYNVFYVEDAHGSPHVVAQNEFVIPYGIRSVIGFGGMMASGLMFATIMFTRVHVPREMADRFSTVALGVKRGLLRLVKAPVFRVDQNLGM